MSKSDSPGSPCRSRFAGFAVRCATTALWNGEEARVQLRDDDVLVVPRVADERHLLGVPGQVELLRLVPAEQELRRSARVEEVRRGLRAREVEAIEVEARRAEVLQPVRVVLPAEARGRVERDVVVDELAEIREPGRERRVVLSPRGRLHHRPARSAELDQEVVGRLEGREEAEEPSEATFQEARPGNALQPAGQLRTVTRTDLCRGSAFVDRHRLSPRRGPGTGSGSRSAARRSP